MAPFLNKIAKYFLWTINKPINKMIILQKINALKLDEKSKKN
jgi:hypothetical protein